MNIQEMMEMLLDGMTEEQLERQIELLVGAYCNKTGLTPRSALTKIYDHMSIPNEA